MIDFAIETQSQTIALIRFGDRQRLFEFMCDFELLTGDFVTELLARETDGCPVWNGFAPVEYRLATLKEQLRLCDDFDLACEVGKAKSSDEEGFYSFLLPRDPENDIWEIGSDVFSNREWSDRAKAKLA